MTTPRLQPSPRDTRLSSGEGVVDSLCIYGRMWCLHTQVLTEGKTMKVNQDVNREALGHRSLAIFFLLYAFLNCPSFLQHVSVIFPI